MLYKFLFLQLQKPKKGDWWTTCKDDLKDLNISESPEHIEMMTKPKFRRIIMERIDN